MSLSPYFLPVQTASSAASFLLSQKGSGDFVLTLNIEMLAQGLTDPDFARIIRNTPYRICDSIGAKIICRLFEPKTGIPRITGIDLGMAILELCAREKIPVFLLGGKEGVAEQAKDRLCRMHKRLPIVGTSHGYFSQTDIPSLRGAIRRSGARVVFVCLGSPLQEKWIIENRSALPEVKLFLPLGGSLDVYAGKSRRAPCLFQKIGMEWLFRLLTSEETDKRTRRLTSALWILWKNRKKIGNLIVQIPLNYVETDNRL